MSNQIKYIVQNLSKITFNQTDYLGKGSYASVYRYQLLNTPLAVKFFDNEIEAIKERDVINRIQEIATDCPGIINFYGMQKLQIEIKGGMADQNYYGYAIFLDLCQSDLSIIKQLSIKEIFNLLSQISLSLFCLHSCGCFHGDLKPANILVNRKNPEQLNYYLTDYGQGKCIDELITTNYKTLSMRGTPFYFSPEVWNIFITSGNAGRYNPLAADIYSLGTICIELLLGQQFLQRLTMAKAQEQLYIKEIEVIQQELLKINEFQQNPTNPFLITLLKMMSFNQKERPQAIEICQALISSNLFSLDALEVNNMKALIISLISSYNPIAKINNTKNQIGQPIIKEETIQRDLSTIPTFQSQILKDSICSSLILSLFEDCTVKLAKIHHQKITKTFNINKFHSDCNNKESTLVIMHSTREPNSFFGGMAIPSWQSPNKYNYAKDPAQQSSWLFKIEFQGKQVNLHQWKCINKDYAIYCDKDFGPYFGYLGSSLGLYVEECLSQLASNNKYYQKQDLTEKLNNEKSLLFLLNKTTTINCPAKVIGQIMNEFQQEIQLSQCEVFTVKK